MAKPYFYLPDSMEMHLIRNNLRIYIPGSFKQQINTVKFYSDVNQDK